MGDFDKGWKDFYYFLINSYMLDWAESFYNYKMRIIKQLQKANEDALIIQNKIEKQRGLDVWM